MARSYTTPVSDLENSQQRPKLRTLLGIPVLALPPPPPTKQRDFDKRARAVGGYVKSIRRRKSNVDTSSNSGGGFFFSELDFESFAPESVESFASGSTFSSGLSCLEAIFSVSRPGSGRRQCSGTVLSQQFVTVTAGPARIGAAAAVATAALYQESLKRRVRENRTIYDMWSPGSRRGRAAADHG